MENLRKLFDTLGKWKPHYLAASLLLVASTMLRMLEPKVLQIAIDGVMVFAQGGGQHAYQPDDRLSRAFIDILPAISMENIGTVLLVLGLLYLCVAMLRGGLMFSARAITASSTEKAIKALRDRLFAHIQVLPLSFHQEVSTGELIQRCTGDVDTVRTFISEQVVEVINMSAIFIGAFVMMAAIHTEYALISIGLVPVIALSAYIFSVKERAVWEAHEAEQDKLTTMAQENLSGIRVVKAFAAEPFEKQRFETQNGKTRALGIKHVMLHAWFWPLSDCLIYLQFTGAIIAGAWYAYTGAVTVGEVAAFYSYAMLVAWPLRRLGRLVAQMGMAVVAVKRLSTVLEARPEDYEGYRGDAGRLRGEIEFRNVCFAYGAERRENVINNVSFHVRPGEKLAIVGPTGAGKSTLVALLTRMYEPDSGTILIDGRESTTWARDYLRERIGVVLQKPFLFSTTIYRNISYARPGADENEVIKSAKAARIHEIVDIFPEGYQTIVGEKGVTLSGGQKQRVTLARTLLRDPDILVLDDATSAVDFETESNIRRALGGKGYPAARTTIIIAHRLSSVAGADRILVLDKGRIVDEGSHEELVRKEGFYRTIHNIQLAIEHDIQK